MRFVPVCLSSLRILLRYPAVFAMLLTFWARPASADVTVTAPANGAIVNSPFLLRAQASTCSSQPTASMAYSFDSDADTLFQGATSLDTNPSTSGGSHTLRVKAWGNSGAYCETDVAITVGGGVVVSAPTNHAVVNSPFLLQAQAATCGGQSTASMAYSLDSGTDTVTNGATSLDVNISASNGGHTLRVKAWGNSGAFCETDVAITVDVSQHQLSNFDDITTGWLQCTGSSCAGGSGNPTSTSQTFNNANPAIDGGSMLLSESGPASSNNGWFYNVGKQNGSTSFTLDLEFNIPSETDIQAVEFDQFQYLFAGDGGVASSTRLFFGTECVTGGVWNVWDQGLSKWISTGVSCSYIVSSTAFNHLTIAVHRVTGDTSCANGFPCQYYDSITLNGTVIVSNVKTNSGPLPPTFGEQVGFMIQLDTGSACGSACTITEYIDKGVFSY